MSAIKTIKNQNRPIRPLPTKSLKKNYFDKLPKEEQPIFYDKPASSSSDLRWPDFCFKSILRKEGEILQLSYKHKCSINQIAKKTGLSRYKVEEILREAPKKMRNDNEFFIK